MSEIEALEQAIQALEAQRSTLGDGVVDSALVVLRAKLDALQAALSPNEQRGQVTILFADIAQFTALAETMDAEDVRDLVDSFWRRMDTIVTAHGGSIDKHIGDAVMAVWGAQAMREDDAERALRAALAMQAEARTFAAEQGNAPLRIRIGVNTGAVLIGTVGSTSEATVMGDAVNTASRLEEAAPVGEILIAHDTYRYVRGIFDVVEQLPLMVKGKSRPISTYLVHRAKARPFRTVTRGVAGLQTQTVGRQGELRALQEAYRAAFAERAVVWAQLVGEPGVGKSRLLDEIADWMDVQPAPFRLFRGRAFAGDDRQPFALIRRLWLDRFQIAEDTRLDEAEATWTSAFAELRGGNDPEAAHALGLLVGLSFADSPHIGALRDDPLQVKGRALVVSRELFEAVRRDRPVVLLLEDLHWADASSWEYLIETALRGASSDLPHGLLVIATARPEWTPPRALVDSPHFRELDLGPLSDDATRELAYELLRKMADAPQELVDLIVARAEGVPYFAEEMVNWFMDQGIVDQQGDTWRFVPDRLQASPLPATLQHLLLTRLSALDETGRTTLQHGSVFGRNFWAEGIAALGTANPTAALTTLQPRGFVVPQPQASLEGESEWSFHHALLRDVAYESILRRDRSGLHQTAAIWLETQAERAHRLDEFAGLLAQHWEHAGRTDSAAGWYVRAGEAALTQGAPREARDFMGCALELLPAGSTDLHWRALDGRVEALDALGERAQQGEDVAALVALAQRLGDEARLAEALFRQEQYATALGDPRFQQRAADEAIDGARRAGNLALEARALASKAAWQTRQGELAAARQAVEASLARADAANDDAARAFVLVRAGLHYSEVGDLAAAVRFFEEAANLAALLRDRRTEAQARGNLGYNYVLLGLYDLARATLERAQQLTAAIAERRMRAYHLLNLGLALVQSGTAGEAHRLLSEALAELDLMGDTFGQAAGQLYQGLALEHDAGWDAAATRFTAAEEMFRSRGMEGFAITALAGQARAWLAQGQAEAAARVVDRVWGYLVERGASGLEFPILAYLTCAQVYAAVNDHASAEAARVAGLRELTLAADKISDAEWCRSFLENVPEHRALAALPA